MASSPDHICRAFAKKKVKLTIRPLADAEDVILIEGDSAALEFLGRLLVAQAHFTKDCGFQLTPDGAGSAFFSEDSTHGFYIHTRHPVPTARNREANGKQTALRKTRRSAK